MIIEERWQSMAGSCRYCDKETESLHSVTVYDEKGIEEGFDLLCDECYADWLQSLKG
jgi:hypothetical protein